MLKINWREGIKARKRERKTKKPVRAFVPSTFRAFNLTLQHFIINTTFLSLWDVKFE